MSFPVLQRRAWLCSVGSFSVWILLLAPWSVWVAPKHALSPYFTRFLPDDLSISAASEHIQLLEKIYHAVSQDAKIIVGSPGHMSVCHPSPAPYATAQMLTHMLQLLTVCVCLALCLCMCFFFLTEEYNTSIQEKLPLIIGSAAAGLVFLIAVVVIIIVCNRWVSRVSSLFKQACCEPTTQLHKLVKWNICSFFVV